MIIHGRDALRGSQLKEVRNDGKRKGEVSLVSSWKAKKAGEGASGQIVSPVATRWPRSPAQLGCCLRELEDGWKRQCANTQGYFNVREVSELRIRISMLSWLLLFSEPNPGVPKGKSVPIFLM